MRKAVINKEHKSLIESIIRKNPKFRGHEELIDIFCEAIYKKSYLLIDAIRDLNRLRHHLTMISDSCIEQILKEQQIFKKAIKEQKLKEDIISLKRVDVLKEDDEIEMAFQKKQAEQTLVNLKEEIQRSERYDSTDALIDPLEFCPQKRTSEATIDKLVKVVAEVSKKYPKKRYFDIFTYRYIKRYGQAETARELKISQVELSKRFIEMIKLTTDAL